ncbi:MAG TPA: aldehyde ferredoxin oxidoreductase family protein [Anaerolineales bacterium]|nr:aldehyde ferredoxin oxidoreductase family protein [Anaerolineales bacterium]
MLGGYANKIADIDLSAGEVTFSPIPEDWARKYIGGRGLGVKYVFENGPQVDPLSPKNILCFMNGPLTGTEANMSGRMAVVTKSPLTGTIVDSHHGGWSAARLRWAGFDGLIFKGKANGPVYAYVYDGKVELLDASEVWGKGVHDTVRFFREKYGERDLSVIAIGQGGEKLSRFANWMNENDRASGRGGTGCVGGSKLLKAIVIRAEKAMPKAEDRTAWKKAHDKALAEIMDEGVITSPRKGALSVHGTNVLMNMANAIGALPTRNSQLTHFEQAEAISGERIKETILVDDPTCHACPTACKKEVEILEGPFKGLRMESFEYESAWALGANCDNADAASVAKLIDLCNDYGLDTIEMGNVLSMYMEASELGYTNGAGGLQWGDYLGMVETVHKIALQEGIGAVLAEGTERAARHFGHIELSMSVKGMAIPAYDPRGIKGMGIGYATSNRGACHLRGYTPASEVIGNVFGPTEKSDPLAWKGKGEMMAIFQNVHTMTDCLDLCKFSTFAESLDSFAAQYSAVTGVEADVDYLLKVGERVYNLERYYNNLAGFREGSDYLPDRFLKEPSTGPGSTGHVCELDLMLEEYYKTRGWVNGVVPEAKLRELEIIA